MGKGFKDHFSGHARDYSHYRPGYPDELFHYLSGLTAGHERAWDCATGNGQAAIKLAAYYRQVIATDASEQQILLAQPHEGIEFRCASAEQSGIESSSVDLITVAQALHWFDLQAFEAESKRVLVDGGILAVWSYNLLQVNDEINALIAHLYHDLLGGYWPFERQMVEQGYAGLAYDMQALEVPAITMSVEWGLAQVLGYLNTWSALKRYEKENSDIELERVFKGIARAWGDPTRSVPVTWPLHIRAWQK